MADNENAPQSAVPQNQAGAEKKEEKKIGTLESIVNESLHLAGNTIKLGFAAGIPFTQATLLPSTRVDTYSLAGAQIAADATTSFKKGKKFTAGNALESSIVGTAITVPVEGLFSLVNKIPTNDFLGYAAKGAAWGGFAYPVFIGLYQFIDYVVKNRTLKGVGKYIRENYWTTLKNTWKRVLPISLLNVFFAPAYLQVPISALLSYVFALFGAPKKDELKEHEKRDKIPYYLAAPTVAVKFVRNSVKGLYDSVYAIGSGISDLYKSAPKIAAPTLPAPAGAHP